MINPNKKLKDMTKKLDDILDWLVDSPMDNKDYNDIHKIFNTLIISFSNCVIFTRPPLHLHTLLCNLQDSF